jgi:pimeloyl-ACP methyl ester carboxylesterase
MMCDARLFSPQIEALSSDRSIAFMPLRDANTITGLAEMVLAAAPPTFALAGLSMGGIVAMEIMRLAPKRAARLALLDTNALAEPPEKAAVRKAQVTKVRHGELAAVMRDEMKPNYLAEGPNRSKILDLCMAMAESLGPAVFEDQSNALQNRPDQRNTLSTVRVPTLILCGEDDRLCPLERHQLMHDLIPDSHLDVIPGAGHLPTLEQPERTNAALKSWLLR